MSRFNTRPRTFESPHIWEMSEDRAENSNTLFGLFRAFSYCRPGVRYRLFTSSQEAPLGAHVVTPRRGYTHHGIYVGGGNVVQYGGLARGLRTGAVEEVPLPRFSQGCAVWIMSDRSPRFDAYEVVRRARSRVGEDRYHLLTNNCEHFCEWCLRAEHRSYQVDEWRASSGRSLQIALGLVAKLLRAQKARGFSPP